MIGSIAIVPFLSANPKAFAAVMDAFQRGLDDGSWPPRRAPNGYESCAIAHDLKGEIMGIVTYFQIDYDGSPATWVDLVYVWPQYRKQGIGFGMIAQIIESLPGTNPKLMFGTNLNNRSMQHLGQRLGFHADHVVYKRTAAKPSELLK